MFEFNGNNLKVNITPGLLNSLKSILKTDEISLYNINDKFKTIKTIDDCNTQFYLPLGIFSNNMLRLNCNIKDNNKIYEHKFSNNYKINIILNTLQEEVLNIYRLYTKKINNKPHHITFKLPCSFGKTVIGSYLSLNYGFKTIIIVNRKILMYQWAKHFINTGLNVYCSTNGVSYFLKKFNIKDNNIESTNDLEDDATDYIESDSVETYLKKNCDKFNAFNIDVLIIPSLHLASKEFCNYVSNNYSICFIDESHLYNLSENSTLTYFLNHYFIKYIFSLSATPRNYNKLYFCYEIFLTDDLKNKFELKYNLFKQANIITKLTKEKPDPNEKIINLYSKLENISKMLKRYNTSDNKKKLNINKYQYFNKIIMLDQKRNDLIIDDIINNYNNNIRGLLIVNYIAHKTILFNILKDKIDNVFIATPENIKSVLNNIITNKLNSYIIISTDKLLSTGFDLENLNTIYLASILLTSTSIIQTIGRINRNTNIDDINKYKRYLKIYKYCSFDNMYLIKDIFDKKMSLLLDVLHENNWNLNQIFY